jgi:hypothetical protein
MTTIKECAELYHLRNRIYVAKSYIGDILVELENSTHPKDIYIKDDLCKLLDILSDGDRP